MGSGEFDAGGGGGGGGKGNPAMQSHPIQGGVEILQVASCCRNRISSSLMSHLANIQTVLTYPYIACGASNNNLPAILTRKFPVKTFIKKEFFSR